MMQTAQSGSPPATNSPLRRVIKGAGAVLTGSFAGTLLQFVSGVVVVRMLSQADYGAYALGFSIVTVAAALAMAGLGDALPQNISGYVAQDKVRHAWGVITSGLVIITLTALLLGGVVLVGSPTLAAAFSKPQLTYVLELVALIIPPLAFAQFVEACFRGLHVAAPKVWFNQIGLRVLRIAGLAIVALAGWGLSGILWITVASYYLIGIALFAYLALKLPSVLPYRKPVWMGGKLLHFALPLFGTSVVNLVMTSSSTLLLGFLMPAASVALYNAPLPIGRFIALPLTALTFLYLPVATAATKTANLAELRSLYRSATRWAALFSLPLVLICVLDAPFVLQHVFGSRYLESSNVLRILALGFFIHCALGPNGMTLLAFGERRTLLLSVVLAATANVLLGFVLIPRYGPEGAAAATALSLAAQNMTVSFVLGKRHDIHPFNKSYGITMSLPTLVATFLYLVTPISSSPSLVVHLSYYMVAVALCVGAPFLFRTATVDDVDLLRALELRLTGRANCSTRLLRWCVR